MTDDSDQRTSASGPSTSADESQSLAETSDLGRRASQIESKSDPAGPAAANGPLPATIGRYTIRALLGSGAFGVVYRAFDARLNRDVAIKVPRAARLSGPQDVKNWLAEAQILAKLDHPNIVPVFDVGQTGDGRCYVVSKFVSDGDLAALIRRGRLPPAVVADVVAQVALALSHAHQRKLVHRDVKPANILIQLSSESSAAAAGLKSGFTPLLADFGLALHDENFGRTGSFAGTPLYMSPEQARGEGHLVDGRSDIYSLGVVLFELLCGQRPYRQLRTLDLVAEIGAGDVRPLRQLDPTIPKELERITLKCLANRASDRYTAALDLAEDLRNWLGQPVKDEPGRRVLEGPSPPIPSGLQEPALGEDSNQRVPQIVPRGLRSFDAQDAEFFLELLPGQRDRDGLPESVRFWKTQIEEADPDKTFRVGLLFGPSGCGKSSLVKAGLLPRLSAGVVSVFVEATARETESRLSRALDKADSWIGRARDDRPGPTATDAGDSPGLAGTMAAIRRSEVTSGDRKLLLVIDQFEQWLHSWQHGEPAELITALRQCDGRRIQCLLLVRDDFGMAAARFLRELEVRILEGENFATVDLFEPLHARRVLAACGKAFGRLPERYDEMTRDQERFLDNAINDLAVDGKIICVRLALFAEMFKHKDWTAGTLAGLGGAAGVGAAFLEEMFGDHPANPVHRLHRHAARAVLRILLPEQGVEIKGARRSRDELLAASGYTERPRDFEELLQVLDGELRLITPVEGEDEGEKKDEGGRRKDESDGSGASDSSFILQPSSFRNYQLTHDFLIPALRDWLTRKERETPAGRARLRLAEQSASWTARPERRNLTSMWEHARIWWHTRPREWTEGERRFMRQATKTHRATAALGMVAAAAIVAISLFVANRIERQRMVIELGRTADRAEGLVGRIADAEIDRVDELIDQLPPYREWADWRLRELLDDSADPSRRLRASLALLPVDPTQVDFLAEQLLASSPAELLTIRDALSQYSAELVPRYWTVVEDQSAQANARLAAAGALARFDPPDDETTIARWKRNAPEIAKNSLVTIGREPSAYTPIIEALRPARMALLESLVAAFRDPQFDEQQTYMAAVFVADITQDDPPFIAEMILNGNPDQIARLFSRLAENPEASAAVWEAEVARPFEAEASADPRSRGAWARRSAIAAAALVKLGRPQAIGRILPHSQDPSARSYLIHFLARLGCQSDVLGESVLATDFPAEGVAAPVRDMLFDSRISSARAACLALGEYLPEQVPPNLRDRVAVKLLDLYRGAPDAGLRSAAGWTLRRWGRGDELTKIDAALARPARLAEQPIAWYVNSQGQMMVVVAGPSRSEMGSQATEVDREAGEARHVEEISRSFAISATEVTVEQLRTFQPQFNHDRMGFAPLPGCAVLGVTWFEAAAYCNQLSAHEGLPPNQWCYEPNASDEFADGMRLAANHLERTGYRLTTEAEWEFACRAGAGSPRCFGEGDEMLAEYSWSLPHSEDRGSIPPSLLKPNDLGLFDMHGNVSEWCQNPALPYPAEGELVDDAVPAGPVLHDAGGMAVRGGGFGDRPANVRSARRSGYRPGTRVTSVGFRVARTIPQVAP